MTSMALTGVGMVSSVGRDAKHSCASIRAGLSRPAPIEYFQSVDDETQMLEPITGHKVEGLAEGFFLTAAWLRLAIASIEDLFGQQLLREQKTDAVWGRTALLAVTPSLSAERFDLELEEVAPLEREHFLMRLIHDLQLPIAETNADVIAGSEPGVALALGKAERLLAEGKFDRILVCAVDSYLDVETLEWLDAMDKLKTPSGAVGLSPGEAAVSLLLEAPRTAASRGARKLANIGAVSVSAVAAGENVDEQALANSHAESIKRTLTSARYGLPFNGDVVADLNGEETRARRIASSLLTSGIAGANVRLWVPATSIGDVGCASGAACAAYAAWSASRGFSSKAGCVVLSFTDSGPIGAFAVSAPDSR